MALLLTAASAWADDEPATIDLTYDATAGAWTYSQPAYDVELEVTYKTDLTLTVSLSGWTYGATANTPTVTGNTGNGAVTYNYKKKDADDETYSADVPTDAGIYTIRATVAETDDYADGTATADFTIAQAAATISYETASVTKTYGDAAFINTLTKTPATGTGLGTVAYTSSSDEVATIDASTGEVTIIGAGSATITATVTDGDNYTYSGMEGYNSDSKTASVNYTLTVNPVSLEGATVTLSQESYDYDGTAKVPTVSSVILNSNTLAGTDYSVSYSNNINAALSTAGESAPTVTVTGMGNYSGSITKTFTIAPKSLTDGMIQTITDQIYTGAAIEPSVVVKDGETTLTQDTHYTVSYSNNTNAALSTAENAPTVTVTGKGNYSGSITKTFTIAPKSLTDGMIQTITDQIYTGAAIEPSVVVKDGETTLTQDTHYTVSYSNNTKAAQSTASENAPTVIITGIGNYSGLITKTFTINKATATISYATTEVSKVFGDAAFTNTLTKTPATGTGLGTVTYEVTAETKDADCTSDHVATIDASTGEVTITGTGSATITATATDGDNYTYGITNTATYTLTVAKGTITASATGGNYSYSASGSHAITVIVTKPSSGYTIKYGTTEGNYELTTNPSYSTIGTHTTYYKVSAPNYNDFTGQATVTINKASGGLSFASSSLTKTYGDDNFVNALNKTGDGAVTYSSTKPAVATVDASTGLVTIKGTGTTTITATMSATDAYSSNYATFSLKVNAANLEGATVALSQTSYDYDGTAKEPTVSAVILNGKVLTSSDYDVSYSNNTNAGTATVTVTGKGNYTGTASQTFTINSVTTTDGNITVVDGGSETVLTINDMGTQQGKTLTPGMQVTTLNYYRSLNASDESVYTVCLPYAPKTDASLKYYTLTGCEGTTLKFDEITGAPQAYTPYLVSASKTTDIGTENLNQPITMSQTVDNSFSAGNYVMKGSLSGFTHDQSVGKYILQSSNRWGLVGSDTHAYIPPFHAYIEATVSGARMLDSSFYDEATGIYSLRTVDRDGTERYYDLNGRRIDDPKKTGIYIRNGRKEVLK